MTTVLHPRHVHLKDEPEARTELLTTFDRVTNSPTKQKYSFGISKSKRFPSVKQRTDNIYTLPSTKTERSAGFGIGDRFANSNYKSKKSRDLPSPDKYEIPSLFNPNNTTSTFSVHNKTDLTYCFGAGREAFSKVVFSKKNVSPDRSLPGPGAYDPLKPLGANALKFKLKSRLMYGDPAAIAKKKNIPPPGHYNNILKTDKLGQYNFNSEWFNSKAAKWGYPYDRFKVLNTTSQITPGPGTHE